MAPRTENDLRELFHEPMDPGPQQRLSLLISELAAPAARRRRRYGRAAPVLAAAVVAMIVLVVAAAVGISRPPSRGR